MEPVPSPESGEEGACDGGGAELVGAAVPVKVTVTSEPLTEVTLTGAEVVVPTGACVVGVTDGVVDVKVDDLVESEVVVGWLVVVVIAVERSVVVGVVVVGLSVGVVVVGVGSTGSLVWRRSMDAEAEATKSEKRREQKT